jgi:3-oxoacyl-[acyl-carrier-protein] synthase II
MHIQHDHLQTGLDFAARNLLGTLPERWGRMGLMGRTALVEIGRVLQKEGMITGDSPSLLPGWTAGLIIGSKKGSLAVDIEYAQSLKAGPGMASPHLFSYTLPNIPLAEAAIQYGLTGPVFCIISDNPYNDALLEARQWLTEMPGSKTLMVAGAMDIIPSRESAEVTTKLKVLHTP